MSNISEFATVDAVLGTKADTCGVDAFALSVIKAERQIRKLFTHLVFQMPAFGPPDVQALRKALADNRDVYFEGFIAGWDALYPRAVSDLVGQEYQRLLGRLKEATRHRDKIFHGQLTTSNLSSGDLLSFVADIRSWCAGLPVAQRRRSATTALLVTPSASHSLLASARGTSFSSLRSETTRLSSMHTWSGSGPTRFAADGGR